MITPGECSVYNRRPGIAAWKQLVCISGIRMPSNCERHNKYKKDTSNKNKYSQRLIGNERGKVGFNLIQGCVNEQCSRLCEGW